ncbi:MAG: DUF5680 domain-containing protein [Patescibacteria group bacterium]
MIDLKQLCKFLVKAKKSTYAAGYLAKKSIEDNKSTTLVFEDGDWKYHDNYFGGEPYGGREVVFYKNFPVYIMVYYGRVEESVSDFETVYKVLRKALVLIPENKPFRGPKQYKQDDLLYTNNFQGDVVNFSGEETISKNGKILYSAKYMGGLVDKRR